MDAVIKAVNDLLLTIQANPFADIVFVVLVIFYILNRAEASKARRESEANKIKLVEMESRSEIEKNNTISNQKLLEGYISTVKESLDQNKETINRLEGIDTSLKSLLEYMTTQAQNDKIDYKDIKQILQELVSSTSGETIKIEAGFMSFKTRLSETEKRIEVIAGQNNRIVGEVVEVQQEIYKSFEAALDKAVNKLVERLSPKPLSPPLINDDPTPPAPS